MTIADPHSLTGAHILHATTDTERVAFERHVAGCEPCAQEVRELRETATRLGLAATATPPAHLRRTVLARIHQTPRTRRVPVRMAAAAVLLIFGALLITQQNQLDEAREQITATTAVLRADDAQPIHVDDATLIVSHTQDRAVLFTDLPPLPPGRVYQAWRTVGAHHTSAGTLAGNHALTEITGTGGAEQIAITTEPQGGSRRPTTSPVTTITIP